MTRTVNYIGMPLKIWAFAFIFALTFLLAMYISFQIRDKYVTENSPGIAIYSNTQNDSVDACFLGSSLTGCALIQSNSFNEAITCNKVKFNYKAFVGPDVILDQFNGKIDEIREIRPGYLFIESNIVCVNMQGNIFWKWTKFRERLARIPVYFFNMGGNAFQLFGNYVPGSFVEQNIQKLDFDFIDEGYMKLKGEAFRIRKIDEFPKWNEFFKEATTLGIRIYLLELPRAKQAEQYLPVEFRQQYFALIDQYCTNYNIKYISFPDELSYPQYYWDRAHFNKAGSQYYCKWLMKELVNRNIIKPD